MSWLLDLYETYESNLDRVGEIEKNQYGQEYTLLPVSHTTQTAHIEVTVTEDGNFHSASVIDKGDGNTLIPCTEESASRAGSKIAPYPLHDKLSYVAGDFISYGGEIKKEEPFSYYIKQLEEWASSTCSISKVRSIYQYLCKRQLIKDLVASQVLCVDLNDRLIDKWDKKYEALFSEKPKIFSILSGEQEGAFIRFNVRSTSDVLTDVWKDQKMYKSFISFYSQKLGDDDLCYVLGNRLPGTERHTNKIRSAGDKAKLISANDNTGFTFRGRFSQSKEVASISYDVSQKAHNALKWLINRQGKSIDQRVFLVWGDDALDIVAPSEDMYAIDSMVATESAKKSYTNPEFAREVAKAMDGYRNNLVTKAHVNIMILDSATTGRMAVLYYRNMDKKLYLERLVLWHTSCVWLHRYRKDVNGDFVQFYGAPATKDIAFAAHGPRAGDKVVKGLMERMIPCIIDNQKIPKDIVDSAIHRASNPVSMERWEWEKTLSITCALINKKEGFNVALDTENNDRDYLFGRLLAVADVLERRALGPDENRSSNAIRYLNSFSRHPARTWKTIQDALQPYQARLGTKGTYWTKIIDEVASRINIEDFNNKPLSGKYLLGFYSQRHELYQSKDKNRELVATANNQEESD